MTTDKVDDMMREQFDAQRATCRVIYAYESKGQRFLVEVVGGKAVVYSYHATLEEKK